MPSITWSTGPAWQHKNPPLAFLSRTLTCSGRTEAQQQLLLISPHLAQVVSHPLRNAIVESRAWSSSLLFPPQDNFHLSNQKAAMGLGGQDAVEEGKGKGAAPAVGCQQKAEQIAAEDS